MRRALPLFVLLAFMAAATVSSAAPKTYQYTGTVKTVDASTLTVEKSTTEAPWTFSIDASTQGTPKVGDKVTVTYKMIATTIVKK